MAYTFLQVVNKTLREAKEIGGDQSELLSFSDSARQSRINIARQAWLEVVQELFDLAARPMPQETKTASITLVEGTALNNWGRKYTLPSDLIMARWPLINESNGHFIKEYPGGWDAIRKFQLMPRNFKGRPDFACIDATSGGLYMDRDPLDSDDGMVYTLAYDRYIKPFHEFDLLPFADNVADAVIPVTVQLYNRRMKQTFDEGIYNLNLTRAARQMSRTEVRTTW